MKKHYSQHKIMHQEHCPFDEAAYSWFKFGDIQYAEKFAEELFNGFINQFGTIILSQTDILLLPSPYHSIPTASNYLCAGFKKHLNRFLFENGKNACIETKMHRQQTYTQDYGNLDYQQRLSLISNDTYYIDRQFLNGKCCLFLDDIKITGSHERTVSKILDQYQVKGDFIFIYYAELINKEIHPNIENHYNYFAVRSVQDIIAVMNRDSFRFNTRIVKYIMTLQQQDFDMLIRNIPEALKRELSQLAISNNYHQIKEYQHNIYKLNYRTPWQSTCKKDNERASMLQNSLSV
ncbi:phosphoribosyltransferase family protein [Sphingobacterium spiritivorum]|uniref:phosphoribosyltransferase family protein n=1 Tax=Sphingobacterium spiritivorum TaxID=258 RepID=UPI003DA63739